jgi:hypothetical protein
MKVEVAEIASQSFVTPVYRNELQASLGRFHRTLDIAGKPQFIYYVYPGGRGRSRLMKFIIVWSTREHLTGTKAF